MESMQTEPAVAHRGEMSILDHTGDTKVMWDATKPDEVAAAQATFDTLRKKGYLAYTVDKNGDKGEQLLKFDPRAERIILSPPLVGG